MSRSFSEGDIKSNMTTKCYSLYGLYCDYLAFICSISNAIERQCRVFLLTTAKQTSCRYRRHRRSFVKGFFTKCGQLPTFSAAVVIHTSEMPTDCYHLRIRLEDSKAKHKIYTSSQWHPLNTKNNAYVRCILLNDRLKMRRETDIVECTL